MELVIAAVKRVWYSPERPARVRVRPASAVGIWLARAKCNLGLAIFAWGLCHLSILHPVRQVGESSLAVISEQMARTPNGTFIEANMPGPRVYLRELAFVIVMAMLAVSSAWFFLAAFDVVAHSPAWEIKQHVTVPIEHAVRDV